MKLLISWDSADSRVVCKMSDQNNEKRGASWLLGCLVGWLVAIGESTPFHSVGFPTIEISTCLHVFDSEKANLWFWHYSRAIQLRLVVTWSQTHCSRLIWQMANAEIANQTCRNKPSLIWPKTHIFGIWQLQTRFVAHWKKGRLF